jgi:hypothetical protein
LTDAKEIKEFMESMKREYSDPTLLKSTLERCKKNGVYFDSRKLDRLWDYENVEKMIQSCLEKLLKVAKGCFTVLRRNSPFRA